MSATMRIVRARKFGRINDFTHVKSFGILSCLGLFLSLMTSWSRNRSSSDDAKPLPAGFKNSGSHVRSDP